MENNFKTYKETAPFVEALQAILQAEEKTLSGFSAIYGEEITREGDSGGLSMFKKSYISPIFEDLKNALKTQIGEVVELSLLGLLKDPQRGKEEVC